MRYVWLLALTSLVIWQLWGRVQARPGDAEPPGANASDTGPTRAGKKGHKSKKGQTSEKTRTRKQTKKRKQTRKRKPTRKRETRKKSELAKTGDKSQDTRPSMPPSAGAGTALNVQARARDVAHRAEEMRQRVRVGTWNLRRLGHGEKRLDWVAAVIDRDFDVIALQEVMTEEGVKELVAQLPGWAAEISPTAVGTEKYQEWYAVLYRHTHARVTRSFLLRDAGNKLMREPFAVCMAVFSFDFCLVSAHIVFGDRAAERDAEIDALGAEVIALRKGEKKERDWLLVGDFNRMPRAPGWDKLLAAGWGFTLRGQIPTSLGKRGYASAYDHILVDGRYSGELSGDARRVDIVADPCGGDLDVCRTELSDHAPIVATFRTDGEDDD